MCQSVQIYFVAVLTCTMIGMAKPCFDCDQYNTSDSISDHFVLEVEDGLTIIRSPVSCPIPISVTFNSTFDSDQNIPTRLVDVEEVGGGDHCQFVSTRPYNCRDMTNRCGRYCVTFSSTSNLNYTTNLRVNHTTPFYLNFEVKLRSMEDKVVAGPYRIDSSRVVTEKSYIYEPGSNFDVLIMTENTTRCPMDKLSLLLQLCNGTNLTLSDSSPLYSLETSCTDNTTMITRLTFYNVSDKFNGSRIIINRMAELLPDKCFLLLMKPPIDNISDATPTVSDASFPSYVIAIIVIAPVIIIVGIIIIIIASIWILCMKRRGGSKSGQGDKNAVSQLTDQPTNTAGNQDTVPGLNQQEPPQRRHALGMSQFRTTHSDIDVTVESKV